MWAWGSCLMSFHRVATRDRAGSLSASWKPLRNEEGAPVTNYLGMIQHLAGQPSPGLLFWSWGILIS